MIDKINIPFTYLIASWLFALIGFLLGHFICAEYLSRFGSLIVLLAAMSEYSLLKNEKKDLYNSLAGQGTESALTGDIGIPNLSPSMWHKKQEVMSHVTIVIGTFIWGFGDLFPI